MTNSIHTSQENIQNRIFLILDKTLLIVDSTNYIEYCAQCKIYHRIYVYGAWPDVRVSFDGKTDLPICAVVHGIKGFKIKALLESEPSFGKFIHIYPVYSYDFVDSEKRAIVYYPTGNIEYTKVKNYQGISIDGKPAVCCHTVDGKDIIINSDGKIINAEIIYPTITNGAIFKVGNGTLKYNYERTSWTYTANPALKTKPAIHE